jgi:hypothetical protein
MKTAQIQTSGTNEIEFFEDALFELENIIEEVYN